ncbi:unnamed protein product [Cylicocyclus nassatus]|uniref:Uncharacterized protein n=1 Tax=Cylicocyclus nassatus TaxID=53992 RepID=A0AA36M3F9_CYLNA|nr:unnamed protein product [Cylicocyclus nassatus]
MMRISPFLKYQLATATKELAELLHKCQENENIPEDQGRQELWTSHLDMLTKCTEEVKEGIELLQMDYEILMERIEEGGCEDAKKLMTKEWEALEKQIRFFKTITNARMFVHLLQDHITESEMELNRLNCTRRLATQSRRNAHIALVDQKDNDGNNTGLPLESTQGSDSPSEVSHFSGIPEKEYLNDATQEVNSECNNGNDTKNYKSEVEGKDGNLRATADWRMTSAQVITPRMLQANAYTAVTKRQKVTTSSKISHDKNCTLHSRLSLHFMAAVQLAGALSSMASRCSNDLYEIQTNATAL